MCEQSENDYLDGEVVWVKLGSCWWPGEVVGPEKLPPDVLPSFRKPPIAVVKFFQEDTFEYVKNANSINKYNCSRKNEFINKGLYMYRTKHGLMEKFPEDVIRAETAVGGDIAILTRDEFQEEKKESYAGLFGDPTKRTPMSSKRGKSGKGRTSDMSNECPPKKIKEKTNYKVHILVQGTKTPASQSTDHASTPSTSRAGSEHPEDTSENITQQPVINLSTPTMSSSGVYSCHACTFTTTRLNVLIMHNKTHSITFIPYSPSPVRKKIPKVKSTPSKTPKSRKPKDVNTVKINKDIKPSKRLSQEKSEEIDVKKAKTDEEIKSSLLADWEDAGEESNDVTTMAITRSPEVPVGADSPDVPTPAEFPSAQIPGQMSTKFKNSEELQQLEKPESSSDSKYEFCEDEDWSLEEDAGRKIPRVKNPSKSRENIKSLSVEDDEVAREVNELLNKTAVPELPAVPDPLKVEENFPELSIAKSPDKKNDTLSGDKTLALNKPHEKKGDSDQQQKTIFKTKTFFRSRHSRSQDAIGKYVAEQLNAAERMDLSESEINGSETVSSPESRASPVELIKVARLAPKIQLKKLKAEAERHQKDCGVLDFKSIDPSNERDTLMIPEKGSKLNNFILNKEHTDTLLTSVVCTKNETNDEKINIIDKSDLKSATDFSSPVTLLSTEDNADEQSKNTKEDPNEVEQGDIEKDSDVELKKFSNTNKLDEKQLYFEQSLESRLTDTAVDALLNVSRDNDRVTKVVSIDPPEDLFDDEKDNTVNIQNGYVEIKNTDIKNLEKPDDCDAVTTSRHNETSNGDVFEQNNVIDDKADVKSNSEKADETVITVGKPEPQALVTGNVPTECDLQIAEALINLPSTAIQNKTFGEHQVIIPTLEIKPLETCEDNSLKKNDGSVKIDPLTDYSIDKKEVSVRYETEQEKSENLNAAQSLVQMSECIDRKLNFVEINSEDKNETSPISPIRETKKTEDASKPKVTIVVNESCKEKQSVKPVTCESSSSKLLKILEKPSMPKVSSNKTIIRKQVIVPNKEKILNFDVGKSVKGKSHSPKQKIIIRRTMPSKNLLNNVNEVSNLDKIILSHSNSTMQDGSPVQTYTIHTSPETSDTNALMIQQKYKKVSKPLTKIQKIKPQTKTSLVPPVKETKLVSETKNDEPIFDINSLPVVLSDDILTPENIEKMPIVMSDGNIITNSTNVPKLVKSKQTIVDNEKTTLNPVISKSEIKTIVMSPHNESPKVTTPNILSKSSKLRSPKPMLVIEKATGKKKIIMTQPEVIKDVKQPSATILQSVTPSAAKTEKFIILPTPNPPRPARTQKIVIDPQTGKAHVFVGKAPETLTIPENKTVSAKLLQTSENISAGNTVMIITNSQGAQSKIILTPEHEKILFPNKTNTSQLKTVTHKISTNSLIQQKTVVPTATTAKGQTRIVPKQKNAIITSKGQLIVGGLLASTTQNITAMPEIRPALKRIVPADPKKIVQTIQKDPPEPLILFQRKSGTVMQLTTAQFEHLQRTGQFITKPPSVQENKVGIQKCVTTGTSEPAVKHAPKQRVRKGAVESQTPAKKPKTEIAIAPAPVPISPLPALTPLSNPIATTLLPVHTSASMPSISSYPDLDNFEELLPSTAIARQSEPVIIQPEQPNVSPQAPISDGQLLAVPGEHFGGLPGSFYLCVEDNGNYTIVDNRPLMLENNELVPMADPLPNVAPQPERRDILEAALANSDVFHAESARDEAPDFRDLNANVSVHCRVSETSTTLNQPIMTPVEVPTKVDAEPAVPTNLEDGLAVIGVTPQTVPTSLELPITVTDPRIAPKTTDPLSNNNYGTAMLPSPNTQIFVSSSAQGDTAGLAGPISMPLLTDDESIGKSMPILTDDVTDRTVSPVESTNGSPSSARESETEDGSQWPQRILTPGSDTSETSSEIPLQPALKLSVNDLSHCD